MVDAERDALIAAIEETGTGDTVWTRAYGTVHIAPDPGDLADALLAAGWRRSVVDSVPSGPQPGDRVQLTYGDGSTVEGIWEIDPDPEGHGFLVRRDDGTTHGHTTGHVMRDVIEVHR